MDMKGGVRYWGIMFHSHFLSPRGRHRRIIHDGGGHRPLTLQETPLLSTVSYFLCSIPPHCTHHPSWAEIPPLWLREACARTLTLSFPLPLTLSPFPSLLPRRHGSHEAFAEGRTGEGEVTRGKGP